MTMNRIIAMIVAVAWGIAQESRASDVVPAARVAPPSLGGYLHVSERTLNALVRRDLSFREAVRESALGMSTRGTAQADCHVALDFRPNRDAALLRLTMSGMVVMDDTVSSRRRIRVYSSSRTSIAGHKDVSFTIDGLRLSPSAARSRSAIDILDVAAPGPLIERIAWRQALKMLPAAEQATERSAARRTEERLEAEAGKPLAELHAGYVKDVRQPLIERGLLPTVQFSTDSRYAFARVFQRGSPPADGWKGGMPPPARDLAVCFRDAFVNEVCADALSAKTLADHHWADLMQTLTGTTPRALWVHRRAEPWEVEFAPEAPLTATFQDETVSVNLRLVRVKRGDAQWRGDWEIAADFSLDDTPDGPRLIRQGELSVLEHGPVQSEAREFDVRGFLETKFAAVLPEELYFDGLIPPEGGSWGRLHQLSLTQCLAQDGWLALGYELAGAE